MAKTSIDPDYPENSPQRILLDKGESWWEADAPAGLERGSLLWAWVSHVDQIPYVIIPEGRKEPTEHNIATVQFGALFARNPPQRPSLPVAAMPNFEGEQWLALKAKRRPVLVLGTVAPDVPKSLRQNSAKYQTSPTITVAPYYGVQGAGKGGGWDPGLVRRIMCCEYPQYMYEKLPVPGAKEESVMRLDHIQPLGLHHQVYIKTGFKLSERALRFVDEYHLWNLTGKVDAYGEIELVRDLLLKEDPPE